MGFEPENVDLKAALKGCFGGKKIAVFLSLAMVVLVALCAWGTS